MQKFSEASVVPNCGRIDQKLVGNEDPLALLFLPSLMGEFLGILVMTLLRFWRYLGSPERVRLGGDRKQDPVVVVVLVHRGRASGLLGVIWRWSGIRQALSRARLQSGQ